MSFDEILSRSAKGESVSSSELLPYLTLERREQRANVNMLLAKAYSQAGGESNLQQAKVFIKRAWMLSRFSPDLLPLYKQIHSALDDVTGIRAAYKRLGMIAAAQGNLSEAIRYFDLWQYAYIAFKNLDQYEYDFDILDTMDRLAQPHRLPRKLRSNVVDGGKIKVAYLVKGITEVGSVLVKINLFYARSHDRARVEPLFFVPESKRAVRESPAGPEHCRLFEKCGYKVITAPDLNDTKDRLLAVAEMIRASGADILVTCAGLAFFDHYFITSLHPAPLTIGFIQGPPEQFTPPSLDWGIAWIKHPLMDSPVDCTRVNLEQELVDPAGITPYEKSEIGIPEEAVVMVTAGRAVKFQEPDVWKAVIELLDTHPNLYYLAMGVEESQIPFLPAMLTPELRSRIRFLGWRGDEYLRGLRLGDIFLDTYPSGAGVIMVDAMAMGIPVVSVENNYLRQYDQTDWSLAEELLNIPEVLVSRGDFEQMKRVVSRLIEDPDYRDEIGRRGQERAQEERGKPERMVQKCEEIYFRVLQERVSGTAPRDARGAEIDTLTRPIDQSRTAPRSVAWTARQLKRGLRLGVRLLDRVA